LFCAAISSYPHSEGDVRRLGYCAEDGRKILQIVITILVPPRQLIRARTPYFTGSGRLSLVFAAVHVTNDGESRLASHRRRAAIPTARNKDLRA
jgi:hypothetical protein